jgi:hypothetical protein
MKKVLKLFPSFQPTNDQVGFKEFFLVLAIVTKFKKSKTFRLIEIFNLHKLGVLFALFSL